MEDRMEVVLVGNENIDVTPRYDAHGLVWPKR